MGVVFVVVALCLCNWMFLIMTGNPWVTFVLWSRATRESRSTGHKIFLSPVKMLINPIMFLNSECSLISKPFRRGITNIYLILFLFGYTS